jgi:RNA polymerase sigma-70 factor (ECF subfamily)
VNEHLQQVFTDLYQRYRTRVYGLAYHLTHNRDDAEDLTQEAFARAWRSFATLRDHASVFAWLKTILVNVWKDRLAARRPPPVPASVSPEDPLDAASRREEIMRLRLLVDSLEERDRIVLDLSHLQGHSTREIATFLGLEEGHVRVILHRARQKLAELLEPEKTRSAP